jgi:hypothetical protein
MIEIVKLLIVLASVVQELPETPHWEVSVNGHEVRRDTFSVPGTEWTCFAKVGQQLAQVRCCTDNVNQCVRASANTSTRGTSIQLSEGDRAAEIRVEWIGPNPIY